MQDGKLGYFSEVVRHLRENNLYPRIPEISGPSTAPEIIIGGKKYLSFCSNNYLGLANNPEIKLAVQQAVERYGVGSGSTRLLSGSLDVQQQFERELANFLQVKDSVTFSSGFLANTSVIRYLADPFPYFPLIKKDKPGAIFSDQLNHASIVDAVRLSYAERVIYKHRDYDGLERELRRRKIVRKAIVTDGVFSMDGDFADLPRLVDLSQEYDAVLYVDDAHGAGVLGPNGEGTAAHLGVAGKVDLVMASFTKAWGSIGGYVAAISKDLADYIRVTGRGYIFSDPIPPAFVAGLLKTLEIIRDGHGLRKQLKENATHLRQGLQRLGLETIPGETAIVPLMVRSEKKVIELSDALYKAGILAPAIRRPAVEVGYERLRLTLTASHTKQHIDKLLEKLEKRQGS
ncbi:MAG: aminotransferase class I/II-fold pyridoxal phosphate-dependent enzyme [bacterium]|nr:aminotransferase class I/II-fold pyridoxal phosphate-dependent enzyme [bacterium]